jgi:hypothetical protein
VRPVWRGATVIMPSFPGIKSALALARPSRASVQWKPEAGEFYGSKITRQGCLGRSKLLLVMKYRDLRDFVAGLEGLGELQGVL